MKSALSLFASAAALSSPLAVGHALAQDANDGIIVYNAQHESLTNAWVEGFTRETGIKVIVRNGEDPEFANQIATEGAASPADVFLTENSPAIALVDAAGLFAPVDVVTLAQVPDEFRPANGHWVGIAARRTVFAYDKTKLTADKLPKSLLDLADTSWKGRWAASPSGADFQSIVGALLEIKGEEDTAQWLTAMKTNVTTFRGNSTAMKAVNSGQIEGAVIFHYYYYGDQAKTGENSKNVGLLYFKDQDPGAFVSISGGGVLASSKHPKEAQAFLKWITGRGGQDVLKTGTSFEYAVSIGADSNPALVPLKDLQAPKVEPSHLNSKKVTDLLTAAGLL
jgi:iron(III) transport system substrate-binding protein